MTENKRLLFPRTLRNVVVQKRGGGVPPLVERLTTRMAKVDERLLAIARGEIEADAEGSRPAAEDPFGGLVPVLDEEGWLESDVEPEPFSVRPRR